MKNVPHLLLLVFVFLGCEKEDSLNRDSNSARIGIDKDLFFESRIEENKIHFGLTRRGEIVFNGYSDHEESRTFYSHGDIRQGVELVLVDEGADGIPDFWLIIDSKSKKIEKIGVPKFNRPEID